MRSKILFAFILGFALTSVGCTSGRTLVMNVPTERIKAVSVNIVEDPATVRVPTEVTNMFRDKLEQALFGGEEGSPPPFTKGANLSIHYRFIQFTSGRWRYALKM